MWPASEVDAAPPLVPSEGMVRGADPLLLVLDDEHCPL